METSTATLPQGLATAGTAATSRLMAGVEDDEPGERTFPPNSIDNRNRNWWVTETSSTYSPSGASPSSSSSSSSSSSLSSMEGHRGMFPSPSSGSLPYDEQEHLRRHEAVVAWQRQRPSYDYKNSNSQIGATTALSPVSDRNTRIYTGPRRRIGRPPLASTIAAVDTTSIGSCSTITTMSPLTRHRSNPMVEPFHTHHHHHHHRPLQLEQANVIPSPQQRRRRVRRNLLSPLPSPPNSSSPRRNSKPIALSSSLCDATSDTLPPPPPLKTIAWELSFVCLYYIRYGIHSMRNSVQSLGTPLRRIVKIVGYISGGSVFVGILLLTWLLVSFWQDASNVCTPPPGYSYEGQRPLVEYYVHGRGIGHYARSVAIVNQLNEAGIDVRLFLSRSSHWRALHEDRQQQQQQQQLKIQLPVTETSLSQTVEVPAVSSFSFSGLGTTSAYAVTSLTPSLNFFGALSHTLERIMGDCEVAHRSKRYPIVVVTDADLPGMLRAKLGGIPSVGIAHGQLFHIAQKPDWIAANQRLSQSWDRQGRLNFYSSLFSSWQIATHFCFLETKVPTGVVARAPLRAEIQSMAQFRKRASQRGRRHHQQQPDSYHQKVRPTNQSSIPQEDRIRKLLLYGSEYANATAIPETTSRRKVVISYFRDHNGNQIQRALLQAGFDVLNFDNGYSKEEYRDPNRYGAKWIVDPHEDVKARRHRLRIFGSSAKAPKVIKNLLRRGRRHRDNASNTSQPRRRLTAMEDELLSSSKPRLIRVMDRSLFVPLMHVADGVVSSAGSQLMSECIYAGMPLLALFSERDDEQRLNVELSHHGESTCAHPHQLVFGSSLEDLMKSGALLLASSNATTATITTKATNKKNRAVSPLEDARREFVKFLEVVRGSPISQAYYDELGPPISDLPPSIPTFMTNETIVAAFVNTTTSVAGADATNQSPASQEEDEAHKKVNKVPETGKAQQRILPVNKQKKDVDDGSGGGAENILPQSDFQGLPDAAAIILEIIKLQVGRRHVQ